MDDDEEEQQEWEEREDNVLSKTNLASPFRKFEKSPKVLLGTSASVKLSKELKLQQDMSYDYERNKVKYKLMYAPDKELKTVFKYADNKTVGGSFTLKKKHLDAKWQLFGEVSSDRKWMLELNWKRNFLANALKLETTNKIRLDRDYEHSVDLKAVYQYSLGDVKSFVKVNSKNLQTPEFFFNSKYAVGWETALFGEIAVRKNGGWGISKYTLQAERKEYCASLAIEQKKSSLTLARDFKPHFVGLRVDRLADASYSWEVLLRKKEGRNELGVACSASRINLQWKTNLMKNLELKLGLYSKYTWPLEWSKNSVPLSISLKLFG